MNESWVTTPIAQVARIAIGGTPSRVVPTFWSDAESGYPWVSIADIKTESVTETKEYISRLGIESSNVKPVPKGTPIMSFKLSIGRTSIAGRDLYTNEAIAAFYPKEDRLDGRFLFHVLPSAAQSVITDVAVKGATLNKKSLAGISLNLPPIHEQRRIAEILDAASDQIRVAEKIITKLILAKQGLVSDVLPLNGDVEMRPLKELADISGGVTLGSEPSGPGTIRRPYLRVANVQDGHLDLKDIKFLRIRSADLDRFSLVRGDVLMNEGGDADKLGRGSVWEEQIEGCLHQNHVFRVRTNRRILDPWFLAHISASAYGKKYFLGASKQTTNLATINSTQIGAFPIPLPDLSEQRRIVDVISAHDILLAREQSTLAKLKSLKAGLASDLLSGRVRTVTGVSR
ncbi:restriction endonuclease subunit S [Arthrobacter sp. Sr33]